MSGPRASDATTLSAPGAERGLTLDVLFLTQSGPIGASARYRVYQYLPFLRQHGIRPTVVPAVNDSAMLRYMRGGAMAKASYYSRIALRRALDLPVVRRYPVVVLQRDFIVHSYPALELLMARLQPRLVFDLDDATYRRPPASTPGALRRIFDDPRKIERIASRCAHFVAGNAMLAAYAAAHAPAVTVIPTSINLEAVIRRSQNRQAGPLTIGWIGSPGTLPYLRFLLPALTRLHTRGHVFTLTIIGADLSERMPFRVNCRPWTLETEAREVASFDIGVMPLSDDEWSRGKSATKLLQYQAAGVAAVASPVGVNADILEGGKYGLPATTEEDWERELARLLVDDELRSRLGRQGRELVEREFSTAVSGPKLLSVLRRVAQVA